MFFFRNRHIMIDLGTGNFASSCNCNSNVFNVFRQQQQNKLAYA